MQVHWQNGQAEQTWKGHNKRDSHLEKRPDDRRHLGRSDVFRGKHTLYDEEIGGPIAHGLNHGQSEHDSNPVHAHRVVLDVAHVAPHMGKSWPGKLCWIRSTMPFQPPVSINPRMGMSSAPNQIRKNCSTSLKIAENSPPAAT